MRNALRNTKVIVADEIKLPVRYVTPMCGSLKCQLATPGYVVGPSWLLFVKVLIVPFSTRLSLLRALCFVHGLPTAAPWNMTKSRPAAIGTNNNCILCTVCPSLY